MNNVNEIKEQITEFFNQPIPIILATVLVLLLYTLVVLSKTSIGKKALNTLKGKITDLSNKVIVSVELANQMKKNTENALKDAKKTIEEQNEHIKKLETLIIDMANAQSNVKVKRVVSEYQQERESKQDGRQEE